MVAHALRLGAPAAACARRPPMRVARRASAVHDRLRGPCLEFRAWDLIEPGFRTLVAPCQSAVHDRALD